MPESFAKAREPMSCYTHFLGACLSAVATLMLVLKCLRRQVEPRLLAAGAAFGLSLLALYCASTVYHYYRGSGQVLLRLRKLDHSIIFVLIAGTYTPIMVRFLPARQAAVFLGVVWAIAIGGIVMKQVWLNAPRWLYTSLYLLLGWAIVFAPAALTAIEPACLLLIALGGISYSVGAVIYLVKRPNITAEFGFHEVFHLFILLGSVFHFVAIYGFVI